MTFLEFITFQWLRSRSVTTTTTTQQPIDPLVTTTTTTILGSGVKMKRALCFGINDYPGTQNDLRGCNADSQNWSDLLKNQYGFEVKRIIDSSVTTANIKKEMLNLITTSKSGDSLVFTYSGHGTSVVDANNDEIDGKDEAICLYDSNMIDDEIREMFSKIPQDVKMTFISDSCYSGTVTRAFLAAMNDYGFYSKARYMPPTDEMEAVRLMGMPTVKAFAYPEEGMNHILLSGTDDKSYSYDANIGGQPCGAFSYYAINILKENPKITYKDFFNKLRTILPSSRYPQTPQLEGSDINKNSIMFE